jgi:hypothetical protein
MGGSNVKRSYISTDGNKRPPIIVLQAGVLLAHNAAR